MEEEGKHEHELGEYETYEGGEIDLSYLAKKMLLWEQQRRLLDELEQGIKDAVLQLKATQTVGYVRATYSNPRKSYDYEGAIAEALEDDGKADEWKDRIRAALSECMKTVVDYRTACTLAEVEPIVTEGEGWGSVSLKLLK
jgi:hypothetical protein